MTDHQRRIGVDGSCQRSERDRATVADDDAGVGHADAGAGRGVAGSGQAETGGVAAGQCATAVALDGELVEQGGTGTELRRHFEHYAVLVELGEDGGDLALTERVVQRVVDGLNRHAEPARLLAIDGQFERVTLVGQIVVDVGQFRQIAQRLGHPLGVGRQFVRIHIRHRVLVFGGGDACVQRHVLHGLQVQRDAGDARRIVLQAGQDIVKATAIATVLQHDAELPLVKRWIDRTGTDKRRHARHIGILAQRLGYCLGALLHLWERDVLVSLYHAGDQAGVLFGQQAFRYHDVQEDGEHHRGGEHKHGQRPMIEHPVQRVLVKADRARPQVLLAGGRVPLVCVIALGQLVGLQQVRAHHRRQCQ